MIAVLDDGFGLGEAEGARCESQRPTVRMGTDTQKEVSETSGPTNKK